MSWIALRDAVSPGTFNPTGIDGARRPFDATKRRPESLVSVGTVLVEFEIEAATVRQNLIRYSAREPWQSSLTLCIDPDNSLRILLGQENQSFAATLPLPLGQVRQRVIVSFVWDAPARQAVFAARLPDIGHSALAEGRNPLPLTLQDVDRIVTRPDLCKVAPEVNFVALSDQREPIGPHATLGAGSLVETDRGPCDVSQLKIGDFVETLDGEPAQIRWVGSQVVPARGSFTPHVLRAPYFGLKRDLVLAPDQKLRLSGSEIEYNFGLESAFASVRDLADGRTILKPSGHLALRYWQVLLDRHAVMKVSGTALESLDSEAFISDPDLRRHSILGNLPAELIPRGRRLLMPILKDYETARLAR